MKYIRTKDGIYKRIMVVRQVCDDKEVAVIKPDKVEFEPILKQADTIEELCDEFVFEDSDGHYLCNLCEQTDIDVGSKFDELVYWFNHSKEEQYKIRNCYGAIWTDKGLIYVAKMNDEWELELL